MNLAHIISETAEVEESEGEQSEVEAGGLEGEIDIGVDDSVVNGRE